MAHRQIPLVLTVQKNIEILLLQLIDKVADVLFVHVVQVPQVQVVILTSFPCSWFRSWRRPSSFCDGPCSGVLGCTLVFFLCLLLFFFLLTAPPHNFSIIRTALPSSTPHSVISTMRSLSAFLPSLLSQFVLQVAVILSLIPRTRVAQGLTAQAQHEAWNIVSFPKVFTSPRAMSCVTSLMSGTPSPGTCTPSLTVIRPTSASSFSCDPLSNLSVVQWRNPQPVQVMSPSILPQKQASH